MVDRIGGIDRGQQVNRVKSMENQKNQEVNREEDFFEENEIENKLDKNELSAEELRNELEDEIDDMNDILKTLEENLSFKLHDETERLMVQVIDIKTDEVLKEMPPEEMLDLSAKIHEMVGLIIDEKV